MEASQDPALELSTSASPQSLLSQLLDTLTLIHTEIPKLCPLGPPNTEQGVILH